MAGLTSSGLIIKTLADIVDELSTAVQSPVPAGLGPGARVDTKSRLGQLLRIYGASEASVWELIQQVYDSFDADQAEGAQLENLCALTGIERIQAAPSSGTLTLSGVDGTLIPAGSYARIPNGTRVVTTEDGTISGGSVDVAAEAEEDGPLQILSGQVTEIVTAVAGWSSVTNAADFTTGRDQETDAELRLRRASSVQVRGGGSERAIQARLLDGVEGIQSALVISNRTMSVDANGLAPKSYMAIVWPTSVDGDEVAQILYLSQPAGIASQGNNSRLVTDNQGYSQTINYQTPTAVTLWVEATITTTSDYPATGDADVEDAILEYADALSPGDDVVFLDIICAIKSAVPGITGISLLIDTVNPPVNTSDISISVTQIADFDSARITVTS